MSDRRRLCTFLEIRLSISTIAKKLSKYSSTLDRELNRNRESKGYSPKAAQQKTDDRAQIKRPSKLETDGILRDYVIELRIENYSSVSALLQSNTHSILKYLNENQLKKVEHDIQCPDRAVMRKQFIDGLSKSKKNQSSLKTLSKSDMFDPKNLNLIFYYAGCASAKQEKVARNVINPKSNVDWGLSST